MANVALLVEGNLDDTVARKIAQFSGHNPTVTYGRRGFGYVRTSIGAFNNTAAGTPLFAIADSMDMPEPCPPVTIVALLPNPHPNTRFRLAVREIESWLLADHINIARFLGVPQSRIPPLPDTILDPKQELIALARTSSKPAVIRLLVPKPGHRGTEGPGYTSELQSFVTHHWDIAAAQARSPSLHRCVLALSTL